MLYFCSAAPQTQDDLSHTLQWAPKASRQGGVKLPWQSGFHYKKWNWTKRLQTHPPVEARRCWLQEQHRRLSTQSPCVHPRSANQLLWLEELRGRAAEGRRSTSIFYSQTSQVMYSSKCFKEESHLPGCTTRGLTVMLNFSAAWRWW